MWSRAVRRVAFMTGPIPELGLNVCADDSMPILLVAGPGVEILLAH